VIFRRLHDSGDSGLVKKHDCDQCQVRCMYMYKHLFLQTRGSETIASYCRAATSKVLVGVARDEDSVLCLYGK
jgi:hypothetical protein